MRDAVDFVVAPDPAALQEHDLEPWPYTGNARPSADWVNECRSLGVAPTVFIQETVSTRSQEGYQAGVYDCQFAEARARALGHVGPIDYVVSDGNSADVWDASEYGRGISDTATLRYFGYGALGVLASFFAGARAGEGAGLLVRGVDGAGGEHVPSTWGNANLVTQVVGPSPIPNTDLNLVHVDLEEQDMTPEESQRLNEVWGTIQGAPAFGIKPITQIIEEGNAAIVAAIHAIPTSGGSGVTPEQTAAIQQSVAALEAATTTLKTAFP